MLDHAQELFLRDGFSRVGMDDVADRAGASKATLYRHFGSKDELFDAVLSRYFDRVVAGLDEAAQHHGTSGEKVRAFVVRLTSELSGLGKGFWDDLRRSRYEKYQAITSLRRRIVNDHLGAIIEEGQRSGEFRNDVPRSVVTTLIFATVEQLSTTPGSDLASYSYGEIIEMVVRIAICGIKRVR